MKVLVTGSRNYEDLAFIRADLEKIAAGTNPKDMVLVHGDADGADRLAARAAQALGWTVRAYPAAWSRWDTAAGPMRNRDMVVAEHARRDDEPIFVCLAYPLPGSRGTWDMVAVANKADIPVHVAAPGCPAIV